MTDFKPMLAAKDASKIRFPVLASVKIDGVRCILRNGGAYSRSLKLIPNPHVQECLGGQGLDGLDGELVVGKPTGQDVMQRTTSGVMSKTGKPDFTFYVFDDCTVPSLAFKARLESAALRVAGSDMCDAQVVLLRHVLVETQEELDALEARALEDGFEGLMVRDPDGAYKYGRSTAKEGGLVKIKRFVDEEAVVTGFVERMHNENEATKDELGHTKRSTHQANKRPAGDLGALTCRVSRGESEIEFEIGTGFTAEQRVKLWSDRNRLLGETVTFRHFANAGVVEKPRFPVFVAFRSPLDLGE